MAFSLRHHLLRGFPAGRIKAEVEPFHQLGALRSDLHPQLPVVARGSICPNVCCIDLVPKNTPAWLDGILLYDIKFLLRQIKWSAGRQLKRTWANWPGFHDQICQ